MQVSLQIVAFSLTDLAGQFWKKESALSPVESHALSWSLTRRYFSSVVKSDEPKIWLHLRIIASNESVNVE